MRRIFVVTTPSLAAAALAYGVSRNYDYGDIATAFLVAGTLIAIPFVWLFWHASIWHNVPNDVLAQSKIQRRLIKTHTISMCVFVGMGFLLLEYAVWYSTLFSPTFFVGLGLATVFVVGGVCVYTLRIE